MLRSTLTELRHLDHIVRGESPANFAGPTAKFQYVINLKTAESLDLTVTLTMQMTADEVSNHVALRPICMDRPRVASPK
jgi:hypothetical protein